jgi:hypothetical protein
VRLAIPSGWIDWSIDLGGKQRLKAKGERQWISPQAP